MTRHPFRHTLYGLLAALVVLVVVGCGSDGGTTATEPEETPASSASSAAPATPESSATSASPAPEGPACAKVWVEGANLKRTYQGCVADGAFVKPHKVGCSSGQTYVLYGDDYWAVRGGLIKYDEAGWARSKAYRDDMAACRG